MTPPLFTLTAQADTTQPKQLDLMEGRPADNTAVILDAVAMLRVAANMLVRMTECPELTSPAARRCHSHALANITAALARIDQ